ncbi:hypothetical protein ABW636_14080 [Aquimarina sp. 2201CG1-2-11]|uniref:hypothetical protein n=1 Tax=Aquimarina discodermiae TaxID=3231043 RepID=UPI0034626249
MSGQSLKTILKLNDLTKSGDIEWSTWRTTIDSLTGLERLLGNSYVSKVKEKNIRIYKYESRHYYDEEEFDWVTHYRLEFIDDTGKASWEFPEELALADLYGSIQYRQSGASEFFEDFLAD